MMKTSFNNRRTGLTLVELLVVIAIMSLLTALIVPQVRLINKDRNIREAGRVVGTTLTQARDRAIATGAAGLMIERNLNLNVGESVFYGGTRLYLMRKLPNFQGEDAVVGTSSVPGSPVEFTVTMDKPYKWDQQSPEERVIQVGDRMRLNHGSIRYPITGFSDPGVPTKIKLRVGGISGPLEAEHTLPLPAPGVDIPFVVERQPRRIESSRVDLPEGYIIDLRYSGYWDGQTTRFSNVDDAAPIQLYFGRDGSLDSLVVSKDQGEPQPSWGSVDLFVTEYRPTDVGRSEVDAARTILSNPAALWVTLNDKTGGVNVGYNSPPTDPTINDVQGLIISARGLSRNRTSANQ